jgi:RND family efflux transporter MFP subunit
VSDSQRSQTWVFWAAGAGLALALLLAGSYYVFQGITPTPVSAGEQGPGDEGSEMIRVEVVRPQKGGMDHTTTQPGSVQPFEVQRIVAEATGYLKTLNVDIGSHVKKGQVLAEIDVPDLVAQVERSDAALQRANALVDQMNARVDTTKAELEEANAAVDQALATARSTAAALRFRQQRYERFKQLLAEKSIDGEVVDEEHERRDAAFEAKNAADAAVITSRAKVVAATAKIRQAQADVAEAKAEVKICKAQLDAARVAVGFATIRSEYNGVVTQRSKFRGEFVRSAASGVTRPLLTVQRDDKFRVVVQVPDQDVPYVDEGDSAVIDFGAQKLTTQMVPGKKEPQPIVVSRMTEAEDPQTRLMQVEIDLYNRDGKIKAGMFGNVTIILDKSNLLCLPSSCLLNRQKNGRAEVFVVLPDGHAHRKAVQTGGDNETRVGIRSGLGADEQVILHPSSVEDGQAVTIATPAAEGHAAARPER